MAGEFQNLVVQMVKERGIGILDTPERCKEILREYAQNEYKREIRLFAIGLEAGCHQELLNTAEPEQTKPQLMQKLHEEYGVTHAFAEETILYINAALQTPERIEKVISGELEKAAKAGDPRAQYELGRLYESQGKYAAAVQWFNEASKQDMGAFEQDFQDNLAPAPQEKPKVQTKGLPDNFVRLKAGAFMMGSPFSDTQRQESETHHQVKLKAFGIAVFTVTQKDYERVIGYNPSLFKGPSLPVEKVSWYDAVEYCNKLSELEGFSPVYDINKGRRDVNNTNTFDKNKWLVAVNEEASGYRLPTEAEWEYACRAGTTSPYSANIVVDAAGWYEANSKAKTHQVGKKEPNPWGIYDMHGNVYEWCWDWYGPFSGSDWSDPLGPLSGSQRVLRGGSWNKPAESLRSAARIGSTPSLRSSEFGFRLVKNI